MGTERSAGGPESIAEAAELLAGAKVSKLSLTLVIPLSLQNPVIISGGGVVMGGGVDAVVQLAEALKASQLFMTRGQNSVTLLAESRSLMVIFLIGYWVLGIVIKYQ